MDGAVFYFNYFSQCYNVVMVSLHVSCIDMGYMYALSSNMLIIELILEYYATLLKRLYWKIDSKCSIFLHQLYFFLWEGQGNFLEVCIKFHLGRTNGRGKRQV